METPRGELIFFFSITNEMMFSHELLRVKKDHHTNFFGSTTIKQDRNKQWEKFPVVNDLN